MQDLGLATFLIEHFPNLPIHASTQMTVHNLEGVLQLEKLGFKRVVLSRELSVDEIEYICKNSNVEIECFIHGALCISYSGQCLLSSSIGGRSGNRGKCAQPCRLPYTLIDSNNNALDKGYLLSPRDLCGVEFLPRLVNAGIKCLKIEGRLKSPEYVSVVTSIYRKYLDLAIANGQDYQIKLSYEDKNKLLQVFNRGGFSNGHLDASANKDLIYSVKPNHMGLTLGNIIAYNSKKGYVKLNLENPVSIGDSIQVEKENNNYNVSELLLNNSNIKKGNIGDIVEIGRLKGNISVGDKVFKTVDKDLMLNAKSTFSGTEFKKIPVNASIIIRKNLPICFKVSCNLGIYEGANFEIESNIMPEAAQNQPIDKERVVLQLSKTGNTEFEFSTIDVDLENNLFVPNTVFNDLRRTAIQKLEDFAKKKYKKENINIESHLFSVANSTSCKENSHIYCALFNNLNLDTNYSNLGIDRMYIPLKFFVNSNYENLLNNLCNLYKVYIYMPTIIRNNYLRYAHNLDAIVNKFKIYGFVVSHISQVDIVNKYNLELIGNYTLNVFNSYSTNFLRKLGLHTVTISPELDKTNIIDLANNFYNINSELIVYGALPLMTSNYCLIGKTNNCKGNCKFTSPTPCRSSNYYLKDRMGFLFKIAPDNIDTITTIYNSKITSIATVDFNLNSFRMDFDDEDIDDIKHIIQVVKSGNRLEGKAYTNGNLNRLV